MGRNKEISAESLAFIKTMQQNELTESEIYKKIASRMKEGKNKETLLRLSSEELRHYEIWKTYSGLEMKPQRLKVWWHGLMASLLGFTFTLKMMENGEALAQVSYDKLAEEVPESVQIREQEDAHEQALMEMLDEERLRYVGSHGGS